MNARRWWLTIGILLTLFMTHRSIDKAIDYTNDASAYLAAAERVIAGDPIYAKDSREGVHEYAYPPTLALLLIPLAALGTKTSVILWCLVSVASWVLAIWLIVSSVTPARGGWFWLLMVLPSLLTVRLFDSNFGNGQANSLILLVFACACHGLARNRAWLAGIAIGVGTALKIAPVGFLAYFLVTRQWRAIVIAITIVATLAILLPVVVLGFSETIDSYETLFVDLLPVYSGVGKHDLAVDQGYVPGQSLRPMVFRYLTPSMAGKRENAAVMVNVASLEGRIAEVFYFGLAGLIAGLGLGLWRRTEARGPEHALFVTSVAAVVLLLASPYARKAYFILLVLPYTYLLLQMRGPSSRCVFRGIAAALILHCSLIASTLLFDVTPPFTQLAIFAIGGAWLIHVKGQERLYYGVACSTALCTLSAPGVVQGFVANRLLALSVVGLSAVVIFYLLLAHGLATGADDSPREPHTDSD